MEKNKNNGVWVYSQLLKKPFATLEELQKAEDEYNKVHAEEIKRAEERKVRAKEVDEAYKQIFILEKEKQKVIDAANAKYIELRNAFIRDYGSYHTSYTDMCEAPRRLDLNKFFDDLLSIDLFK